MPSIQAGGVNWGWPLPAAHHLYVDNAATYLDDLDPATGAIQGRLAGAYSVLVVAGTRVFTTCAEESLTSVSSQELRIGTADWWVGAWPPGRRSVRQS